MREKLRGLIDEFYLNCFKPTNRRLTDYLIANGVTIQKWIPVTERTPKHGDVVLCYMNF